MNPAHLRVLILGGYGTFGGRLAQLLIDEPRLTLIIAGRSRAKAEAFCSGLRGKAGSEPLACDRDGDLAAVIGSTGADIVVDATGPFQVYGDDPYRVVKAALAAGISYIDLSDGADFVAGIAAFDDEARAKGCFVLSGASSFPVLTAAVTRKLAADGTAVATITGGVAPSPHAGVGLNVIRAIASYAGRPIGLRRDGRDGEGHALVETWNRTIAPPGHLPLRRTRFSLVDVPDLRELPRLWPAVRSVWMGAGPVPEIWHRGLNLLALLVRWKVLPSLTFLAPLFHAVIDRLAWGEHRGGMVVEMTGAAPDGRPVARSWHLAAEGDGGPFIPSMAVEALIRHQLDGRIPAAGARSAATALELEDYEPAFAGRGIVHGFRDDAAEAAATSLYRRLLGSAFEALPAPLRAMHGDAPRFVARGRARVERGSGPFARVAAALIGFPAAGEDVPVEVVFERTPGREVWRRTFAGRCFSSVQEAGTGRAAHLLVERFGVARFDLALVAEAGRLKLIPRRWSVLGIPLPLALAPGGDAFETVVDGKFHFHVEIGHRLFGLAVRYRGWLEPVADDLPQGG
ncbi:MAG: DUF4166 domain-containing protein [Rhizobiales bacterium]|nr:DUF4166 domain-containing protein [Hyphomicrobiales bacterium]